MTEKQPITEYVLSLDVNKALTLGGISYILYTTEGEFVRSGQPCYGELRKYEKTHQGECTQPKNAKPGDLHHPFPDGTPTGLIVPFPAISYANCSQTDLVMEAMFSKDSPWYSGFKDVTFIRKGDRLYGVVINDMDIDATVMVNAFKQLQSLLQKNVAEDFALLLDNGLTPNEALAACMLNGVGPSMGAGDTFAYQAPTQFSAKRFFNKTPNDLTGGFLRDRVDYNRTDMHKPFWGNTGFLKWKQAALAEGIPSFTYVNPPMDVRKENIKFFAGKARDIFNRQLDTEADPVILPFEWTTTSGKARANGDKIAARKG